MALWVLCLIGISLLMSGWWWYANIMDLLTLMYAKDTQFDTRKYPDSEPVKSNRVKKFSLSVKP